MFIDFFLSFLIQQAAYALGCEKRCILCIQDLPSVVVIDGESVRIEMNYFFHLSCYHLFVQSIFHTLFNRYILNACASNE